MVKSRAVLENPRRKSGPTVVNVVTFSIFAMVAARLSNLLIFAIEEYSHGKSDIWVSNIAFFFRRPSRIVKQRPAPPTLLPPYA